MVCGVCEIKVDEGAKGCTCGAVFKGAWICNFCDAMVPPEINFCSLCEGPAPQGKVGSAALFVEDDKGAMVITPAGHMAARQGEAEEEKRRELMPPFQQGRSAAAVAAVKILASSSSKVQALTMMKPILIQKIFSGKRGELWVCDKAGRVMTETQVG
jgi:hypothetical protein